MNTQLLSILWIGALGAFAILGLPAEGLADNCSGANPTDCQAVPPNVVGTLGVAGVAATLGLLHASGTPGGEGEGGGGPSGDSDSFLDEF